MATVVYLDVEDEITSAASRIRTASGPRVGLVLPFGSRVATSRINFRLLAREAQANGRRLDIVAPDASARALAASAGLPVFASVAEYEAAIESLAEAGDLDAPFPDVSASVAPAITAASGSRTARGAPTPPPAKAPVAGSSARTRPPGAVREAPAEEARENVPVAPARRRGPGRGLVAGFLALVIILVGGGAVAAMYLPSATITITPRIEAVPPVSLTVTADPSVTEVDVAGGVIPATVVQIPVSSKARFQATGKKVIETNAVGQVRFDSINTVFPVSVPRGTRLSTLDGVVFQTTSAVVVPTATVSNNTIRHGFATVGIAAVRTGTAGNVDAGTITQAPDTLGTQQITVSNPSATARGTHTETVLVAKKDVDAALDQLTKDVQAQFAGARDNPPGVPAGATLYPTTAKLGDVVPSVDPAKLVGKAAGTFDLQLDATGTILAVDSTPAGSIGEAAVRGAVTPGYQLVQGSIDVTVGDGTVAEDGTIRIPVAGTARQLRPLDAAALKAKVLGLPEADTRAALQAYGAVDVVLWPGWVTAVPTNDGRVTLTINDAVPAPAPSPSGSPRPTPKPTVHPSPSSRAPSSSPSSSSPAASPGDSPVPSG